MHILEADITITKDIDLLSLAQRLRFILDVRNDCHCACLSNKSLSYKWLAFILRHPVLRNIGHLFKLIPSRIQMINTKTNVCCGGARDVMVIVEGIGHDDTSSNPGRDWLHFT